MNIKKARALVPGTLISDYLLREVEKPRELIILLHGYQLSGEYVFGKFAASCPESAMILAPNGPYPLPFKKADGQYQPGFAWYFYDPASGEYFIDMKVALELLEGMVASLGLQHLPKRIVGYSQGGYLAPFAALRLGGVTQVVGIASEFLADELGVLPGWPPSFRMDSIHGAQDDVVPATDARRHHFRLVTQGLNGQFNELPDVGHRIGTEMQASLREILLLNQDVGLNH